MSKYIKLDETVNALVELEAKLGSQQQAKRGVRFAIGYVNDLPTIEGSRDYISRVETLATLNAMMRVDNDNVSVYSKVFSQIKDAPSVVPQVPSEDCIDRYSALAELDPLSYEYEVIKELPSVVSSAEPKRENEDLISRQDALDAIAKFVPYVIDDMSTESYTNGLKDAYNLIYQLPIWESDEE